MKKLIPLPSPASLVVLLARLVLLVTFMAAIVFMVGRATVKNSAAPSDSAGVSPSYSRVALLAGPLALTVNMSGDAADANIGDGICDTDTGTAGDQCTLRAAIQETNNAATDDTITFNLPANTTITLNAALPDIGGNLTITGPGSNQLTVRRSTAGGTPLFRIFTISASKTVTIAGLTITNGMITVATGGGILNSGTLTLTSVTITGNATDTFTGGGGGISNSGTLTVTNSTISGNQIMNATGGTGGGGIYNPGTLTMTGCTVSGNTSTGGGSGGGIYNKLGMLTVTDSTVSGNTANGDSGGGFYNSGTLTLRNSTVSGNTAGGPGGGLYNAGPGTATLINTTVSENIGSSSGGGIYNPTGTTPVGTVNLKNTIIAGSILSLGGGGVDVSGIFNSLDYNVIKDTSGAAINGSTAHNITGVDPLLGPLANNGGPTQTHALLLGSPAINAGDNCVSTNSCTPSLAPAITTDQRGFARVINTTVDIGAFESRGFTIAATGGTPQNASISAAFGSLLVATVTSSDGEPVGGGVVTFAAPGSGASGTFPGGLITATVVTNSSGVATSPSFTANGTTGTYSVTAGGNAFSSLASFSLTNQTAASTTILTSSASLSYTGQSVTFTATVSSMGGTPGGTVQFKIDSLASGAPVALVSGAAQMTTSALAAGSHTITADYSGNVNFLSSSGTLSGGQTVQPAPGGIISFAQANYSIGESAGSLTVTVNRTGNTSGAATVSYATDDGPQSVLPCSSTSGMASSRCDFTTAMGKLNFGPGESVKTVIVLVNRDSYTEGPESFTVNLSNQTGGAVLAVPASTTVTIADDSSGLPPNGIDDAQFFVLQHYHDFLNRQPDASGLNFWTNQITSCGSDQQCIELRRINVSAAFFLSIEFQETGYLVERLYKTAYGDADQTSNFGGTHQFKAPIIRVNEFLPDTQEIGLGVVVGQTGWETVLENNKRAFTAEFVQRAQFTTAFPLSMTPQQFVDTLNTNAGKPLSASERNQLVADLTANTKTRAEVLRAVAEDPDLVTAESNRAFVLMQFFGYLRRNPNDAPDSDYTGYDFWLTKLNQFNGNFVNADMVKAFITSSEYRQRFGP